MLIFVSMRLIAGLLGNMLGFWQQARHSKVNDDKYSGAATPDRP
jgi:hypothetical protein